MQPLLKEKPSTEVELMRKRFKIKSIPLSRVIYPQGINDMAKQLVTEGYGRYQTSHSNKYGTEIKSCCYSNSPTSLDTTLKSEDAKTKSNDVPAPKK